MPHPTLHPMGPSAPTPRPTAARLFGPTLAPSCRRAPDTLSLSPLLGAMFVCHCGRFIASRMCAINLGDINLKIHAFHAFSRALARVLAQTSCNLLVSCVVLLRRALVVPFGLLMMLLACPNVRLCVCSRALCWCVELPSLCLLECLVSYCCGCIGAVLYFVYVVC